ncbi:LexA family protein [Jonquetella anthropi]|uniref:LexA family protein n=1 Tax=Jonquetella anthropi TaxID=428712 RepID=UPI0023F0EB40|nr:LexA family transcriptional regulator [Jonquetella anthropi]
MIRADLLKELREARKITQEELGKAFGKSKWTVIRIEKGKAEPTYSELEKIASALGVTTDYLMGRDENKKNAPTEVGEGERKIIPMDNWIKVPVLSREWTACCGDGITTADITNWESEMILVPSDCFHRLDDLRRPFSIHCEGDCLESAGILDGDLAVINPAEEPAQGAIALVSIAGSLSLKRFYSMPNGDVILQSDHGQKRMNAEQMERDEFMVCGVLAGTQRGRPKPMPL